MLLPPTQPTTRLNWTRRVVGLIVLILQCATVVAAAELGPPTASYTSTLWTERDGLPSTDIFDIAQDHDGFLWLATRAGLVRFDGRRFVLWGQPDGRPA